MAKFYEKEEMKKAGILALIVAAISFIAAIITRIMPQPPGVSMPAEGIKPEEYLLFAVTCVLFAIALILLELFRACKKGKP